MRVYIIDEIENVKNESIFRLESIPYEEVEKFKNKYWEGDLPSINEFVPVRSELIRRHELRVSQNDKFLSKLYEGRLLSDTMLPGFSKTNSQELTIEGKRFYLLNCSGYDKKFLTNFYNVSSRVNVTDNFNVPHSTDEFVSKSKYPYFFLPINVQQGNSSLLFEISNRQSCYFVDFGGDNFNVLDKIVDWTYEEFDEVTILLTHWDEDHYNYLKNLTSTQIQKTTVHSPFYPRLKQDAINTLAMIIQNGGKLFLHRNIGQGYRVNNFQFQRLNFHQSNINTGRLNKNNTGICYLFRNIGTIGFPGDCSYNYTAFGPQDFLYVTHHGSAHFGNVRNIPLPLPNGRSIFSYGRVNIHGHPTTLSINSHQNAKWIRQNCNGHWFLV